MVHDVGLQHGAEDRLQTVFATGWWMAAVDANYDSQLDQMIVATANKFTVLKKLWDDIVVPLQPARPGSSLPATLISLHGWNLFQALVALRLPADATKMSTWKSRSPRGTSPCKKPSTYTSMCTRNHVHRYLQGQ